MWYGWLRTAFGVSLCLGVMACHGVPFEDDATDARTDAIIGGAADARYPVVGVLTVDKGGQFCTGTLVAPQLVLTAAHCVKAAENYIKNGKKIYLRMDTPSAATKQTFHEAQSVQVHPQYKNSSSGIFHDLGVVVLKAKVTGATPMKLMTYPMDQSWRGRKVLFLGYGLIQTQPKKVGTKVKQGAEIPIRQLTQDRFETYEQGKSICSGDSGGPALYNIHGAMRVVGVNSYVQGTRNGNQSNCDGSGFSFRIDVYMDWLRPLLFQYGYACKDKYDCGNCHTCTGGKCIAQLPTAASQLCKPCASPADCGGNGNICVRTAAGNRCMQACATNDCCPSGYQCTTVGLNTKQCTPPDLVCPPVKCTQNTQCGPGESCQSGVCKPAPVPADPKLCKSCKQDSDCPTKGVCLTFTEGKYCSQPCAADNFCPTGYECKTTRTQGRQCFPKVGYCACKVGQAGDCQAPFVCDQGQCKISGGGTTGQPCDGQSHPCAADHFCVKTWASEVSQCVRPCEATSAHPSGQPGSLCRDNVYCDMDAQCVSIQGGKRACLRQCTTSQDCPNGGRCYAQGNTSFCFCQSDKECKNGMTCNKSALGNIGLCAPSWPTTAKACPSGESCSAMTSDSKICTAPGTIPAGEQCSPLQPCAAGLLCLRTNDGKAYCFPDCTTSTCSPRGGACVTAGSNRACVCNTNARCNKGYYCNITTSNGGACAKGTPPSCANDWECAKGDVCLQSKCIADPNPPCKSQSDCSLTQLCRNGKCVARPPQEPGVEPPATDAPGPSEPGADAVAEVAQEPAREEPSSTPDDAGAGAEPAPSETPSSTPDEPAAQDTGTPPTDAPQSDKGQPTQDTIAEAPGQRACGCQTPAQGGGFSWLSLLLLLSLLPVVFRR